MLLAGCGPSVSGTYSGGDSGFFESLTFKGDGKVEVIFLGVTSEGSYEIEDERIRVSVNGQTVIMSVADDGCIEGGGMLGRYCKA